MQQDDGVCLPATPARRAPRPTTTTRAAPALCSGEAPLTALVTRLTPVVRTRVARRLGPRASRADVDDIVQDLWVKLLEPGSALTRWTPGGMSLENYVGRAAEWQAGRHCRRGAARRESALEDVPEPAGAEDVERALCERQCTARLRERVAAAPERGRKIFDALYVQGMTPGEAATSCGVAQQVVYNWQHRIRALGRAALGGG